MAPAGFLSKKRMEDFLKEIGKDALVHVPVLEGNVVVFRPYGQNQTINLERPANAPPKAVIFPQSDTFFTFRFIKDPQDPKKVSVEINPPSDFPEAIIFGCRPCDAKGFKIYDKVYIEANGPDPYYMGRREKTTIITLACPAPSAGCFCTALGGGPAEKDGSDILMTDVGEGFYLEPVTEKGDKLLKAQGVAQLIEDGAKYGQEATKRQKDTHDSVKKPFESINYRDLSRDLFDDDRFWEEMVSKCISCGACTYLCPTCYCFNITDEKTLEQGERLRSWDSCMFKHFTLEASGHNPRPTKFKRYKNRIGHKFLWYPEKYEEIIACCGCGRCIRYCPVSVDISEIVSNLRKTE
ncbi:MAG: 4Fe-4S dicluster domain-containing protein [Syntrophorhabdaceae bacterium]|nr:4Fe-4S dicluster domain-containing protein [Syntrophorhabdaceae bacterium]